MSKPIAEAQTAEPRPPAADTPADTPGDGAAGERAPTDETPIGETPADQAPDRWLTIPNALCVVRILGSFAIVPLAFAGRPVVFLACYVLLAATDWFDGKIARWLDQRSRIGPKLDSISDVTMYLAMLVGAIVMFGEALLAESLLIGTAIASYAASCLASQLKFQRLPSYHTRAAKFTWFVTLAAVGALFLDWSIWPLRIAAFLVALTNLEAMLITLSLRSSRDDVPSLFHALHTKQ